MIPDFTTQEVLGKSRLERVARDRLIYAALWVDLTRLSLRRFLVFVLEALAKSIPEDPRHRTK